MERSTIKMAAPLKLVNMPVGWDAISWSEDNRIAVATEKCVNIFNNGRVHRQTQEQPQQLVGTEARDIIVQHYDWNKFLETYFQPPTSIKGINISGITSRCHQHLALGDQFWKPLLTCGLEGSASPARDSVKCSGRYKNSSVHESLFFDPSERNQDMQFENLIIKPCRDILKFDVGIEMKTFNKKEETHSNLVKSLQTDKTLTPPTASSQDAETDWCIFRLARWSPVDSEKLDRTLLACLDQDHRLTIYNRTSKRGKFTMIVDLSLCFNKLLTQQEFTHVNEEPLPKLPSSPSLQENYKEFRRRVYMLAAVTMDWSGIFQTASDPGQTSDRATSDSDEGSFLLLAVAMKSGHVVIWKLRTPFKNPEADVSVYSVFDSGYQWPASLSWCRLSPPQSSDKASYACLAVGDREGCISLWTMQEDGDSTPSFSKCLDLWPDKDLIAVSSMAWTYTTPMEAAAGRATLVAAKGFYLMAFLIDLSSMTLIQKTHTMSQHTMLATSLCVFDNMAITTSTSGGIHKADIDWSRQGEVLGIDILDASQSNFTGFGFAMSPNGVYLAIPSTLRLGKRRPYQRDLKFMAVTKMDSVVRGLLDHKKHLSKKTDQLEYIRQAYLRSSNGLPPELESIVDGTTEIKTGPGEDEARAYSYRLRLKRFLLLMRLSRMQGMISRDVDGEKEQLQMVESNIREAENELLKLHIVSALTSWQQITMAIREKTTESAVSESTTLLLMADWLTAQTDTSEEPIRSLVAEVYNTVPHSSEVGKRESCDLCGKTIAFTNTLCDACPDGHGWSRCQLSLRLCQTTSNPQVCLQCDAMALPAQNQTDSLWLRRLLQQRCILCESVFAPS